MLIPVQTCRIWGRCPAISGTEGVYFPSSHMYRSIGISMGVKM